ncbi:hypothetical protein BRC68_13480 [Halobacteriales archaeon QH_6_64_20]|jgi:hypothetical protein|nr:MAG: hypothetical protein BRC68_13480 [Halobacteriales archaeon QH_6_64_20]
MMPSVPDERLAEGGWTLVEETSETRFEMPTMRVVGYTRLYEDAELREATRERTGIDRPWRFFFAARLAFEPPLAPGIGPAMVYGSVSTEAKREFATDLESRGFRDVSRSRGGRIRTETDDRASLTKYDASYRLDPAGEGASIENATRDDRRTLPVTGWLAVWVHENAFRLAGGAYPERSLASVLDVADERLESGSTAYREELLDLVRAVR